LSEAARTLIRISWGLGTGFGDITDLDTLFTGDGCFS